MEAPSPAIFENFKIRRVYDAKTETWYFFVVDIIQVLLQQPDFQAARKYWKVLKNRLSKEGSESVTKCNRLKLEAADGKAETFEITDEPATRIQSNQNDLDFQKRVIYISDIIFLMKRIDGHATTQITSEVV